MSSTFKVEIVPVVLEPHPNADRLSLVRVFGYQCVVATKEWEGIDKAAYIPPESLVPDKPEYQFLAAHPEVGLRDKDRRVTARRFRKEWSYGLLMPAPEGAEIGADVAELMEVTHYEPPMRTYRAGQGKLWKLSDQASPPPYPGPHYDIENLRRYDEVFKPGEPVIVTEKIHGTNVRVTYQNGEFHVASRNFYRKEYVRKQAENWLDGLKMKFWDVFDSAHNQVYTQELYWTAVRKYPDLLEFVKDHSPLIFYGEIYGPVQADFDYDSGGELTLRLFDVYDPRINEFVTQSNEDIAHHAILNPNLWVPWDGRIPFDMNEIEKICQSKSHIATHIREGCVVTPVEEGFDPAIGRRILKVVNPAYLEKL